MAFESTQERDEFSLRLISSIRKAGCLPTPALCAREYNLRAAGAAVTAHAMRKWLCAEAIPTQERMRVLARWLGVSAQWLRFGEGHFDDIICPELPSEDLALINDIQLLNKTDRKVIEKLTRFFLERSKEGFAETDSNLPIEP
jgi:hypothetical protein